MTKKTDEPIPKDIAELSFEQALEALEDIVKKLEEGTVGLEDSIDIYTRGTLLKRHCEEKLKLAEARIEKIRLSDAGEADGAVPFDAD
ncbi:MAG: exodeoxyribonuclease VII small subunit [Sphingomonadales bacterium]|nr:exodeoxyribonuclease VII small subunit [Sphingomonadales bacterium]